MIRDIRVIPARLKIRDPFIVACKVADTDETRAKGFQNTNPHDATMPLILHWDFAGTRILHNENVLFDVSAFIVDHQGWVRQEILLKAGDPGRAMTAPCRLIIEIPENLDGIIVEVGDKIQYRD